MTLNELLDEYVKSQGGDDYLRAWLRSQIAKNPDLLDELLIEKLKKEIQQDVRVSGKKGKPPPIIK